jgi:hypothetical protein
MADSLGNGTEGEEKESKTETISVKVTPTVKRQVQFVATLHDCDAGPMLYEHSLNDLLAEYRDVKEQLKPEAAGAAS